MNKSQQTALERFVLSRWYRGVILCAVIAAGVKAIENSRGPDFPSWIAQLPDGPFYYAFIILAMPIYMLMVEQQRERSRKFYDPDDPKIRRMAGRYGAIGVTLLVVPTVAVLVAAKMTDLLSAIPTWAIVVPISASIIAATFLMRHSTLLQKGLWSPPDWIDPPDGEPSERGDNKSRKEEA